MHDYVCCFYNDPQRIEHVTSFGAKSDADALTEVSKLRRELRYGAWELWRGRTLIGRGTK